MFCCAFWNSEIIKLDCYLIKVKYFLHQFAFKAEVDLHFVSQCPRSSQSLCCRRQKFVPWGEHEIRVINGMIKRKWTQHFTRMNHITWLFPGLQGSCEAALIGPAPNEQEKYAKLSLPCLYFLNCSPSLTATHKHTQHYIARKQWWS